MIRIEHDYYSCSCSCSTVNRNRRCSCLPACRMSKTACWLMICQSCPVVRSEIVFLFLSFFSRRCCSLHIPNRRDRQGVSLSLSFSHRHIYTFIWLTDVRMSMLMIVTRQFNSPIVSCLSTSLRLSPFSPTTNDFRSTVSNDVRN